MSLVMSNISSGGVYTEWLNINPFGAVDVIIPSAGALSGIVRLQMSYDAGSTIFTAERYIISAIRVDPVERWTEWGSVDGCQMRLGIINAEYYSAGSAIVQLRTA